MKKGIMILLSLFLVGCSNGMINFSDIEKGNLSVYDRKIIEQDIESLDILDTIIESKHLNLIQHNIEEVGGIGSIEDYYVVSDSIKNQLNIINKDGDIVKVIGKTGNGNMEFSRPTTLTMLHDKIYIIDQLNYRIQVFDQSFNFVESIAYSNQLFKYPDENFDSIAVDDQQNIYLSQYQGNYGKILMINSKDSIQTEYGNNLFGSLASDGETIYFLSIGSVTQEKDLKNINNHRNYLYQIDHSSINFIKELPLGLLPSGLVVTDREIVFYSATYRQLMKFSKDGNYLSSIAFFDDGYVDFFGYSSKASDNRYVVSLPQSNLIYEIIDGAMQ